MARSFSVAGLPAVVTVDGSEGANDSLVVRAHGGNDNINASTLVADVVKLTIDGGTGNDTILGSRGADMLLGGDGNDFIDGQQGDDVALLGDGDDVFQWDPGDGNDTIEGQDGTDKMLFNGANIAENIDISANGGRVRFFRDVANITMDLNDVERIDFDARGGADNIVIGDLSGTDLVSVNLDLAGVESSGTADGATDTVTLAGTNGADTIAIVGSAGNVTVSGLPAIVNIKAADPADGLTVNALGGNDTVDASGLAAGVVNLTLNGGLGNDVLIGGAGNDFFNGGDGDDLALMGAGDDTFVWNPGDDNDTLEGQAGSDTMLFNGANIAESIDIAANGGRVRFFRNVANVTMDLDDVENITFNALGGADLVVVNDLSGTDVTDVNLNLAATGGAGDGAADSVVVKGTSGDDVAVVFGDASGTSVLGLSARVNITAQKLPTTGSRLRPWPATT